MYESEKKTLQNHIAATAARLLKAKDAPGASENVYKVLEVGIWLDKVEAAPDPEPTPKPVKK